jgi:hypothetical protein
VRAPVVALVVALAAGAAGCVLPPSRTSIAAVSRGTGTGYRFSSGVHSAAADARDTAPVDLGAGYVGEDTDGAGGTDGMEAGFVHGTYVSLGRRIPLGRHDALWVSGRAEMFWLVDPGQPRDGLSLRLAYRRHIGGIRWGTGGSGGGVALLGALATGFYVDAGVREFAGGGSEAYVSAGVELDLPLFVGIAKATFLKL